MKQIAFIFLCIISWGCNSTLNVEFKENQEKKNVEVWIDGSHFTTYEYGENIEKPVLYPVFTPSGKVITRGFPLIPRPYEHIDHPHQVGLWFNFGDVNGLDFWNNSYAIPIERKNHYGTILFKKILSVKGNRLETLSNWVDNDGNILLEEKTTFLFGGDKNTRIIEREAELTAKSNVTFTGNKEGMIAMRLDRIFEEKATKPDSIIGKDGSRIKALNNDGLNGVYRNSLGDTKGDVWGKRAPWTVVTGEKEGKKISIAIIDNKNNINYPGWSFARGYGLFALNNLGGKAFDKNYDKPVILSLAPGEIVVFKYKVVIRESDTFIEDKELNEISEAYK